MSHNDPPLDLARQPISLLVLPQSSNAHNRQVSLLQLLLDNLPSAHGDLAVDRTDLLGVHLYVRQIREVTPGLEKLG